MEQNNYKAAADIDLVDLLSSMGYTPQKISGPDYWYCSPLREEKTASFKVNRNKNVFYDHGSGMGGSTVRFIMLHQLCSMQEAVRWLLKGDSLISFAQKSILPKAASSANKIQVLEVQPLQATALLRYLSGRCIPANLAMQYCVQVQYQLKDKTYYAIGFKNDSGGYELRNKYYKGSSSPKAPSFFDHGSDQLIVFEGFFNFLSYLTLQRELSLPAGNYLVLNSLAFFAPAKSLMERHQTVLLNLDRDTAGMQCTATAIAANQRYKDASQHYANDKDWNQWHVQQTAAKKAAQKQPIRLIKKSKGRRM